MKARSLAGITATLALIFMASTVAFAQLSPAAELVPAGFKVTVEKKFGAAIIIHAKKPNENFPKGHMDPGIDLEITWMNQPMAKQLLDMLAKQPEDPARQLPGSVSREEPCGKQSHLNGVLTCRKITTPWVGGGNAPDLVTWRVSWAGSGPTGMGKIEINNLFGSKEIATGWIDGMIPKILKGK